MNFLIEDLTERVEALENFAYTMQKSIKNMPFGNFLKYDLGKTFTISGEGSFVLGNISSNLGAELFVLCKINTSANVCVYVDIGSIIICSKEISANSSNELHIFAIKCNTNGSLSLRINAENITGTISDISVFVDKNATFSAVSA